MSYTPRTDAACGWPWGQHGRIESSDLKCSPDGPFVHSSVARELERENAALRSDLNKCNNLSEIRRDAFYEEKSTRWAMVDRIRDLKRENAALRELSARMATEMREVDHEFASLRDYDAARKEPQP